MPLVPGSFLSLHGQYDPGGQRQLGAEVHLDLVSAGQVIEVGVALLVGSAV